MDRQKIEELFAEYENAFNKLDLKTIAQHYPDTFISAGPKGTIAQNKKEFESKAEQAADMYRSIGQNSAKILSKKITPISNEYCMVTVHWGVTFEKTGDEVVEFDVSYIVQQLNDELSIILFITHQDEAEAMKKLGLKPEEIK
jgi:ketosteroid isomerase-like protein